MKDRNQQFIASVFTLLIGGVLGTSLLWAQEGEAVSVSQTGMDKKMEAVEKMDAGLEVLNPRSETSLDTIKKEHEKLSHITIKHKESDKVKTLKAKQGELLASLLKARSDYMEIKREIETWEKSQVPTSELSHSEEIMHKAKNYSFSKRLRNKLQVNSAKMSDIAAALDQNMKDIKTQQSLDELLMKIKAEKARIAAQQAELEARAKKQEEDDDSYTGIPDINDYKIKLYTVTERSSLKKLAGNPDLYSDGGMWKVLENANRPLIKRLYTLPKDRGDIIIPAGETILVPRQEEITDFYKEDESK